MLKLNTKRPFGQLTVSLIVLCITFACKKQKDRFNDSYVFRYNEHKNINSLDPVFAKDLADIWGVHQLFNGLVQMDDQLNVIPSIAKYWTISDSGRVYTFNIRPEV